MGAPTVKTVTGKRGKTGKQGRQGERGLQGVAGPRWRDCDISKMDEKLDKVVAAIYEGNGQASLMDRTARIEVNVATMLEASTGRDASISRMSTAITNLTTSVDEHHKTLHLVNLLKDKKFWGYALTAFVAVTIVVDVARPLILAVIKAWTGLDLP